MAASIRALVSVDLRNITRDSMLKFLLVYPIFLGLALRWLVPAVQRGLLNTYDITPLYPLLFTHFGIAIVPALGGVLIGFLLLDERDADTLTALQVTPLPMSRYLGYRIALPLLVTAASIFIVVPLMDLLPVDYAALIPISLLASLLAPIFALLLISLAANKVQGLAVMKGIAIVLLTIPFIAWFVPQPWQWLFGVVPTFWPMKAFWVQHAGGDYLHLVLIGLGVAVLYLVPLLLRFNKSLYRTH